MCGLIQREAEPVSKGGQDCGVWITTVGAALLPLEECHLGSCEPPQLCNCSQCKAYTIEQFFSPIIIKGSVFSHMLTDW